MIITGDGLGMWKKMKMIVALYEDDGDDDFDKDHDDANCDDVECLRCTAAAGAQVPEAPVQWSSVGVAMFGIGHRHRHHQHLHTNHHDCHLHLSDCHNHHRNQHQLIKIHMTMCNGHLLGLQCLA